MSTLTITTLILDGAAFLIMFCLLLFSGHLRRHKRMEGRIFFHLCLFTMIFALVNAGSHLLHYQDYDSYIILARLLRLVSDLMPLFILFDWLIFVDYTLYQSKDNLARRYKISFILVILCGLLLVVNLFVPVAYEFDRDLFCHSHIPFYVMLGVEYLFLLLSFLVILQYRIRHKGQGFFAVFPFAVPVLLGICLNDIHPELGTFGIGTAVGLLMMYLFLYRGIALVDEDSGFYTAGLLELLKKYPSDKNNGGTAIIFSCEDGNLNEILQENKPYNSLVVILSEKEHLLLAAGQAESAIRMLIECVEEDAREAGFSVKSRYERQEKSESTEAFLQRVL